MSEDKKISKWRVNRKKHGFTWSKPTGVDVHPIKCVQDVVNHLLSSGLMQILRVQRVARREWRYSLPRLCQL